MSKIYKIGTLSNNDIVLNSEYVSRSHADITCLDDGTYLLTDHSKNGTTVNGFRVQNTSISVKYGDNVLFAGQIPLDWSRIQCAIGGTTGRTVVLPPPPPPTESNGMAVAGFICSFFVPLLGLIFSIIGMNKAKNLAGKGHGWALAGIIISCVGILGKIIYFLAILAI